MSYFMSSMFCAGLIEMPPVSKVTPLPTSTTGAPSAPLYSSAMKRGSSALPCATASSAPIFSLHDRGLVEHGDAEAMARGDLRRPSAPRRSACRRCRGAPGCPGRASGPRRSPRRSGGRASTASVSAGASMSTRSSAGFFSSGGRFISLNCQTPCASPSAIACPASSAGHRARAIPAARWNAARGTPSDRARLAAVEAARRMLLRVISSGLPSPTSRTRAAGPGGIHHGDLVTLAAEVPGRRRGGRARRPAASSSSASDGGNGPRATASASNGVS